MCQGVASVETVTVRAMNPLFPLLFVGLADAGPTVSVAVPAPPHARILRAIELPIAARSLRRAGALEVDVRLVLDGHRRHHLHASDALLVFETYHLHGPVHGFGSFVVTHLDDGVRGPSLAKAIRYKHGKGHWKGNGHGRHDEKHRGKHLSDGHHVYAYGASGHDGHGKSSKGYGGHGKSKGNGNGHGKGHDKGKK